jgi:sugar transferase (PEP-CTERM/EpsH1 system associated)
MGDILFLAHRIPYPPDKGDKIRSWNILRYLAERATVHLGAFVDDRDDLAHADALRAMCKTVKLVELRHRDRLQRAWRGWRGELPLSVALYDDRAMKRWVWERIKSDIIDRIFVFSSQMAPYALGHTAESRTIVMDFVDIDSDKFAQYAADSRWPWSSLYRREARLLAAFEKQVARHVDRSLFVSDAEAAMFRRMAGSSSAAIEALGNGVDLRYFAADAAFEAMALSGSPRMVFTGAMDYRPNIDAVVWFAQSILPMIRASHADACFYVVGNKPAAEVVALGKLPGVVVTGRVPDVRPYLAAADVVVAPVRIARGVQNKVLEAMAMARPVVATTAAWSGIEAEPGRDLVVRDQPDAFAAAVVALAGDTEQARRLGTNARRLVERCYAWNAQLAKLDAWLGLEQTKDVAA